MAQREREPRVKAGVRTSPDQETTGWPPGVPYIIGNEGCERFSYYGMKSILYVYMAQYLYRSVPSYSGRAEDLATAHYHLFSAGVYALPMIGAVVADRLLGKYRTILWLSLVYCSGHAVLSMFEGTLGGLFVGLALIAIGSGGIKPCVSAHVGDQFGKANWFRLRTVYQAFYFMINFGSFFSMLLIPWVFAMRGKGTGFLADHAVSIAFGIPGVLMFLATLVFWMGRKVFVHVPPAPGGKLGLLDALCGAALFLSFGHLLVTAGRPGWQLVLITLALLALGIFFFVVRQRREPDDGFLAVVFHSAWAHLRGERPSRSEGTTESGNASRFLAPAVTRFGAEVVEGPRAVLRIMGVFIMVSVFWALFDQGGSSWVRQAQSMRTVTMLGMEILPAQLQALNPVLVMLLIPIMNLVVYPGVEKLGIRTTPLRRMTVGMLLAAVSFLSVAILQAHIDAVGPGKVSILWQAVPYLIITVSEVLVSITGLEFAYTQAPKRMKSTIMAFWLSTVALGNLLVSLTAEFGKLPLVTFFGLFTGLMLVAAVLFGIRAHYYVARDYVQE